MIEVRNDERKRQESGRKDGKRKGAWRKQSMEGLKKNGGKQGRTDKGTDVGWKERELWKE